ncbi:MAG: nicotinamide mononucleotide transporter [Alphaproteobacteria bacterium]|nr:nicotinamide mononucleotide transporter [Alphaproteobacteria bacterium]
MTGIEIIAALLGLANIVLIVRRSVWNYMFGLLMVSLYFFVFLDARLYSDALLQIFFFVVQIYGWWHWARVEAEAGEVVVERLSALQRTVWSLATALTVFALGSLMRDHTNAAYPIWDASVAGLSVVAQILMSRRYVENWLLWILVDIIGIGLYAAKGLWPTVVLYAVFLVLAVVGFVQWLRAPRGTPAPAGAGAQAG